jgi:hypothetical protein
MERLLQKYETPEAAQAATREAYRQMTPNERVSLTVRLQREFFESHDAPRRLSRVLTVLERP